MKNKSKRGKVILKSLSEVSEFTIYSIISSFLRFLTNYNVESVRGVVINIFEWIFSIAKCEKYIIVCLVGIHSENDTTNSSAGLNTIRALVLI